MEIKASDLKMARPRFAAVERTSVGRLELIVPVRGQKVKGIGPSALEVLLRSREKEPAGPTDRTTIATCLGHNLDARLQKLQSLCRIEIGAKSDGISDESINTKLMIVTHDLITIASRGRGIT